MKRLIFAVVIHLFLLTKKVIGALIVENKDDDGTSSTATAYEPYVSRNLADSPYRGTIFINEVASTPTRTTICPYKNWIELINTGNTNVALGGFILHDDQGPLDSKAFTFGNGFFMYPNSVYVICGYQFSFSIDMNDTITLLDASMNVVSTTGVIPNVGNASSTYQRTTNNTYMYGRPTPEKMNFATFNNPVLINEVASSPTNIFHICIGSAWIELINTDYYNFVDLNGMVLHDSRGPTNTEAYTFTNMDLLPPGHIRVICGRPLNSTITNSSQFTFNIDDNDTITLLDFDGQLLSSTGIIPNGGNATSTFQRAENNKYLYGFPTPNRKNFVQYILNDDCIDAALVDPLSKEVIHGQTTNTTFDTAGCVMCYKNTASGVWYQMTNPKQTTLSVTATAVPNGYNFHPRVIALKGEKCSSLECATQPYYACYVTSTTNFVATSMSTYYIYVGADHGESGSFTLSIDAVPLPPVHVPIPVTPPAPALIPVTAPKPAPTPVSIPVKATTPAPAPNQVSIPIVAPTVYVPVPVESPSILVPVPFPMPPLYTGNPIKPTTPIQVSSTSPIKSPIRSNCGLLFGWNLFCLGWNECGFWRRLLNLRGC